MLSEEKIIINLTLLRTLWATIMAGLASHAHLCNTGMNIMGGISHIVIGFKFCSTKYNPSPAPLSGQPIARRMICPRVKATTIILLN